LVEIDRGRQAAKEAAKDHERQVKELRAQLSQLQAQRNEVKKELQEARAQLRITASLKSQMEKRLAGITAKSDKRAGRLNPSQPRVRLPSRSARHDPHRGSATHNHARTTPRHLGARRYRRLDHAALDAFAPIWSKTCGMSGS
jgi:DNA repair exonuclease SbcCD ATPase subunit